MEIVPDSTARRNENRFIDRLCIPGCSLQAGEANRVIVNNLDPAGYRALITKNQKDNLYIIGGVDPSVNGRATDADVHSKNYFVIDIDVREAEKKDGRKITDDEIKELGRTWFPGALENHPFLSLWSHIVFSGNGIHIWYIGKITPIRSVEKWSRGVQYILCEFQKHTKQEPDYSCTNVSRLIRLPGSYNNKGGRQVRTEILVSQDREFDISLVEKWGADIAPREDVSEKKKLTISNISEGKRNATLTSLAGSLHHRGMAQEAILATLLSVNEQECKPPLPKEEVEQIAKSIGKYPVQEKKSAAVRSPVVVCLEDVQREEVKWLWGGRIAYGKLTLLEGDPSVGKSTLALAIASALTRGETLYGDNEEIERVPAKVLLLIAEDGLADTIRPRLDKLEADPSQVRALVAVQSADGKEQHFSIARDLEALEAVLVEGGYGMVIIDPLNAYLGGDVDTNRDSDLRTVLSPLTKLAEKYAVALVCIRHLTKSPRDKAIYRGLGSIGYTAVARTILLVGKNPLDPSERIIICTKNNLAIEPPAIAFEITNDKFLWRGEKNMTAEALLAPTPEEDDQSAFDEAKDFLQVTLADEPKLQKEIIKEAKKLAIAETTLRRAKKELGVTSEKKENGWIWKLHNSGKATKETIWPPWSSSQNDYTEAENSKMTNMTNASEMATLEAPYESAETL